MAIDTRVYLAPGPQQSVLHDQQERPLESALVALATEMVQLRSSVFELRVMLKSGLRASPETEEKDAVPDSPTRVMSPYVEQVEQLRGNVLGLCQVIRDIKERLEV